MDKRPASYENLEIGIRLLGPAAEAGRLRASEGGTQNIELIRCAVPRSSMKYVRVCVQALEYLPI